MNSMTKFDLFISYRREGGVDYARMIYLELRRRGYHAFFDYNSLRDGKFNERIFKAIDECRYFILVLTDGSLERCRNEDDWVRREIVYALSRGKRIVPVCPAGNVRAFPDEMPQDFAPLKSLQVSILQTDDLFEKSVDKIVEDRFDAAFRKAHSSARPWKTLIGVAMLLAVAGVTTVAVRFGRSTDLPIEQKTLIADVSRNAAEDALHDVLPKLHYMCAKCGSFTVATGARKPDPVACKSGGLHKWQYLQQVGDEKYQCKQCGKVLMTQGLPMDAVLGNIRNDIKNITDKFNRRTGGVVANSKEKTEKPHRHVWEKVDPVKSL